VDPSSEVSGPGQHGASSATGAAGGVSPRSCPDPRPRPPAGRCAARRLAAMPGPLTLGPGAPRALTRSPAHPVTPAARWSYRGEGARRGREFMSLGRLAQQTGSAGEIRRSGFTVDSMSHPADSRDEVAQNFADAVLKLRVAGTQD